MIYYNLLVIFLSEKGSELCYSVFVSILFDESGKDYNRDNVFQT